MARERKAERRNFGYIRRLPSGRYQASYIGPDTKRHTAPITYDARGFAEAWLEAERRLIQTGEDWQPPAARAEAKRQSEELTLTIYADQWLTARPVRPTTRKDYRHLIDDVIAPGLGARPLRRITRAAVRHWWASLDASRPRTNAKAYALLRTILGTAVDDEILTINPAQIRGAAVSKRRRRIEPATLDELATITAAMPARLQLAVLLGSWCALRYGEMAELRRSDVDLDRGVIKVRRGAVWLKGEILSGPTKTAAGVRDVAYPPHLDRTIRDHLATHAQWGRDGLLFPATTTGAPLSPSTFHKQWAKARRAAGRPDLRFHDLRHTGAVMAAQEGATIAELQARLGHTTAAAAMIYQHAATDRDALIAQRLSDRLTAVSSK